MGHSAVKPAHSKIVARFAGYNHFLLRIQNEVNPVTSLVEKDFDRLALLDSDGWTHNNHYHDFLLNHVPDHCFLALEIGCGTGEFSRCLANRADHVVAVDLSPQMIRVARDRSSHLSNIEFQLSDIMSSELPADHFDCIASIATLHHLPAREALLKIKRALKPSGVLLLLDLFQPRRTVLDALLNIVAGVSSVSLNLIHNRRLKQPRAVRAAWEEHGQHDSYPTMNDVRMLCEELLPGALVQRHLFWRYSIKWQKQKNQMRQACESRYPPRATAVNRES